MDGLGTGRLGLATKMIGDRLRSTSRPSHNCHCQSRLPPQRHSLTLSERLFTPSLLTFPPSHFFRLAAVILGWPSPPSSPFSSFYINPPLHQPQLAPSLARRPTSSTPSRCLSRAEKRWKHGHRAEYTFNPCHTIMNPNRLVCANPQRIFRLSRTIEKKKLYPD